MILPNLPWKPVAKEVATVAAREAGIYLYRLAKDRIDTKKIRAKVGEKLSAVRRHFETEPEPEDFPEEFHHPEDPEEPSRVDPEVSNRRSRAAQRGVRDENGRFIRKTPGPKGGDTS